MSWKTAAKIAWRDARASSVKFVFVVAAVAIGVGSLAGVRGFSRAFRTMLLQEARTLMAADLSVRVFEMPTTLQNTVMAALERRGVRRTWVTETLSMMSSPAVAEPLLVSVKAVDPGVYPFYGKVRTEPAGELRQVLTDHSLIASDDLLVRLRIEIGDSVRLGGQDFRVAAVMISEPDRMSGSLNVGPRVLITREALARTGLIQTGSRASQRFLFRLPPNGPGVEETRQRLQRSFRTAQIADFRETHPTITRGLNRATTFLSLVSLIALIVGALGVAMAMHSHLRQKMDSIAIMKCVGARSGQVIRIYLMQALVLGLMGSLLGIGVGFGVQALFPVFIERYFEIQPALRWDAVPALQGLGVGLMVTLLFTLPPLMGIRNVRPALIFRREMAEVKTSWRRRWKKDWISLAAGGAIVIGLGLLAASVTVGSAAEAFRLGAVFAGGLVVSLLALAGVAWLLLRGLRTFLRVSPWKLPVTLRHGIANLYRPGNQAEAVLVALGVGVMFTLTVYLVQHSMVEQIGRSAPPGMANVFLINITSREQQGLLELLKKQPGVEGVPEMLGAVSARLVAVDGQLAESLGLRGWERRFLRARGVTSVDEMPDFVEVLSGSWWSRSGPSGGGEASVSINEEARDALRLKLGSKLEWSVTGGRRIAATVTSVHRVDSVHLLSNIEFILSSGALEGMPVIYYGGARVQPRAVPALQRAAYERFPTVTVINAADVLQIVQEVVDQIALVIRFVSFFAILAGVVILASSIAGTRLRRIREVVILKTLGATRRRIAGIFSVEFFILGAVAGLMGSLLATAFTGVLLRFFLEADPVLEPVPILAAIALTAVIAAATGWLASFRILGQKPLEALRGE